MLLHGFPQTSACWTPLLEALAAAGYRAVAPDQRGYSPEARPTAVRAYRLPKLVADVLAVAYWLGAARIHLVGHDWGGVVAWRLAGWHPDRVATLTAVSTPTRGPLPGRWSLAPRRCGRPTFRCSASLGCPSGCWARTASERLHRLLAQDGLGAEWVDTYTRALAQPGGAVGRAGLLPGGHLVRPAARAWGSRRCMSGLGRSGARAESGHHDWTVGHRRLPV